MMDFFFFFTFCALSNAICYTDLLQTLGEVLPKNAMSSESLVISHKHTLSYSDPPKRVHNFFFFQTKNMN